MQRKTISPQMLAQLQDLDNPGPGALRPKQSRNQGGVDPRLKTEKKTKQNIYTPALSLAEHQQVSNQAFDDSKRQTALDYAYAQKAASLRQKIGQEDFSFQVGRQGYENRLNAGYDFANQRSAAQSGFRQNQVLQNDAQRHQASLNKSNNNAALTQSNLQGYYAQDAQNRQIEAQKSMAAGDRDLAWATANLQAQTQKELANRQLVGNILSGNRAGYRYW